MNDFFQLDIEHGIAHLQLNRPERMNTMAPAFFPLAIAGSKLAINHARDHGTAAALHQMTLLQSAIFDSTEMALAIDAWKAKRQGDFASLEPTATTLV